MNDLLFRVTGERLTRLKKYYEVEGEAQTEAMSLIRDILDAAIAQEKIDQEIDYFLGQMDQNRGKKQR